MTSDTHADVAAMMHSNMEWDCCSICGVPGVSIYPTLAVEVEAEYDVECTYCGGPVSFSVTETRVAKGWSGANKDFSTPDAECARCGNKYGSAMIASRREAESASLDTFWTLSMSTRKVVGHHVCYESDTTVPLCDSHHGMVHNTDGFFDGLQPENWELGDPLPWPEGQGRGVTADD